MNKDNLKDLLEIGLVRSEIEIVLTPMGMENGVEIRVTDAFEEMIDLSNKTENEVKEDIAKITNDYLDKISEYIRKNLFDLSEEGKKIVAENLTKKIMETGKEKGL